MAQQQGSGGFLKTCFGVFAGLGLFGTAIVCCIAVICVAAIALIATGQEAQQEEAIAANAGRGDKANPIAAGDKIRFDEANLHVTRMIQPANVEVEGFNHANAAPAAGTEYVLIWVEVECLANECNRAGSGFRLVDSTGKEWEEPDQILVLDPSLDQLDGIRGSTYAGWQVFEFPIGETIDLVMVRWANGAWLYVEPPAP